MNLYGCIPPNYLTSPSSISYWAQAAALAGIPVSDLSSAASLNLGLKKPQLPASLNDVIQKNRGNTSLSTSGDFPSPHRLTSSTDLMTSSADLASRLTTAAQEQLYLHLQKHQHLKRQQHIQCHLTAATSGPRHQVGAACASCIAVM